MIQQIRKLGTKHTCSVFHRFKFEQVHQFINLNHWKHETGKITILLVINTAKIYQKGLCPISCRITLNKARKQFATGLLVNPNYWENKLQKVNTQDPNCKFVNAQIKQIQTKINNIVLVFQLQNGD